MVKKSEFSTIDGDDYQGPQDYPTTELAIIDLEHRVRKLREELLVFKKNPGTWNVMRYYLKGKGFQIREIDRVLNGVDDFLSEFIPTKKK